MLNRRGRYLLFVTIACATNLPCGSLAIADGDHDHDWIVATLAATGAWGVGRSLKIGDALSKAIVDCQATAGVKGDCGAEYSVVRGGWTVASLCGHLKILATGRDLREAEFAVLNRELVLSEQYGEKLSACTRIFTVSPIGSITVCVRQVVDQKRGVKAVAGVARPTACVET